MKFYMHKLTVSITLVCVALITGCGGRAPRQIAVTNLNDNTIDCAGIAREFHANERQIQETLKERNNKNGKNVVLAAAGVFLFFPALFFLDPKSPEGIEINAWRNRNQVLRELAQSKKCLPLKSQLTKVYKKLDDQKKLTKEQQSI